MVIISWKFLFSFMFCMSLSSVIRASQLFMADERMRQSMKSLSMFLNLKAVCRIALSCIGRVFIVSLYIRALMPLEILSGGIIPEAAYLAPFAESSNMVMSLMKIWCSLCISLVGASFGKFLTEMPITGRKYVVSSSSFKFQPSGIVLF